jgi:hypothetical protein
MATTRVDRDAARPNVEPGAAEQAAPAVPCVGRCAVELRPPTADALWALRNFFLRNPGSRRPGNVRLVDDELLERYAQSPDLSNDELGYGEEVRVALWHPHGPVANVTKFLARRTKTGRTPWQRRNP